MSEKIVMQNQYRVNLSFILLAIICIFTELVLATENTIAPIQEILNNLSPLSGFTFDFEINRIKAPIEISNEEMEKRMNRIGEIVHAAYDNTKSPDDMDSIIQQRMAEQREHQEQLKQGYSYFVKGTGSTFEQMRKAIIQKGSDTGKAETTTFVFDGQRGVDFHESAAFVRDKNYTLMQENETPLMWLDRRIQSLENLEKAIHRGEVGFVLDIQHVSENGQKIYLNYNNGQPYMSLFLVDGQIKQMEVYNSGAKISEKINLEDYEKLTNNFSFPRRITRETFDFHGNLIATEIMIGNNYKIDGNLQPSDFQLKLPAGTFVTDMRHKDTKGQYMHYTVPDLSSFLSETLIDLENLSVNSGKKSEVLKEAVETARNQLNKNNEGAPSIYSGGDQQETKKMVESVTPKQSESTKTHKLIGAVILCMFILIGFILFIQKRLSKLSIGEKEI